MKKIMAGFLLAALLLALAGCGNSAADGTVTALSFSAANSIEQLRSLDGRKVSIIGYMATLSPVSGKFIYLMNLPYQSCPFCVPNTSALSNTMAVYAPDGKTFEYTDQAVRITGTLKVEDYIDEYGYTYNYRVVNAASEVIDLSEVSEEYALWQTIASDGIVGELNAMLDYLNFLCQWNEYEVNYTDDDGNAVRYFLYPGDVELYLEDDSAYGYADKRDDGYFPGLITRIRAISPDRLEDLVAIVESAREVEQYALGELKAGNYAMSEDEDKYILTNGEELYNRWYVVWTQYSQWLARWEV